ncbi:phage tail assembly chaperone [Sphingopyxis sp.]|uniref:phage tail assembly chaperone n=1 Tax=Sphingopyxis sp. TaxID=1908224 RepID=UPI002587C400|nr:phage tail assembly chaperone [Sphingopyxis sp.]
MADDRLAPGALALAGVMARVCGWRPGEFWAATPAEVAAVLAGWRGDDGGGGGGINGAALAAMMEQYPDG